MTLPAAPDLMSAAFADRPVCIGCDRRSPTADSLTCRPCRSAAVRALDYIARGFAALDVFPTRGGGSGGRGAPGYGSRSPIRLDVLDLIDVRAGAVSAESARAANRASAPVALGALIDRAALDGVPFGFDPDRAKAGAVDVGRGVAMLLDAIGDLGRSFTWPDFARDVAVLAGRIRRALGEHERTALVGRCVRPATGTEAAYAELVVAVGETVAARAATWPRCGGEIRGALDQWARCRDCGHSWHGPDELRRLSVQLGDAMLDLPGLARMLGARSAATLRSWAHRDGWRREKQGGRTVYALADARRSWWAAWERANPVQGPWCPPGWRIDELGRSAPPADS